MHIRRPTLVYEGQSWLERGSGLIGVKTVNFKARVESRSGRPAGSLLKAVNLQIIDDERRENAFGLLMSLNMLIETTGGFDFTGADSQEWMRDAGFSSTRVEPLVGPDPW